jgi:hypothetical protein
MNERHLLSAVMKLRYPIGVNEIRLYPFEADALFAELCRLANLATLLGEPSPAEIAGIFTREECEAIAARITEEKE